VIHDGRPGRRLPDGILYEADVPAGAPAGTSSAAAARVDHPVGDDAVRARRLRLARLAATLLLAGPFTTALRQPADRDLLDYHQRLLALRRQHPELCDAPLDQVVTGRGDRYVTLRRGDFLVIANLAAERRRITVPPWPRGVLIASRLGVTLNADAVELPGECAAVLGYR
jgi:hypothetical protein